MDTFKKLPKFLKAFIITFLCLAVVATVINFAFGISFESGVAKALIAIVLIGVPAYVHFKDR